MRRFRHTSAAAILAACFALNVSTQAGDVEIEIGPDEGLPHVGWLDAESVVGRIAYVSGQVAGVGHSRTIHFVNFDTDRDRRNIFKLVVFDRYLPNFPGSLESLYTGKNIEVRGFVTRYAGKPQIQVTSPDQIRVLETLPETAPTKAMTFSPKNGITVATYNIRNLYDSDDCPYHSDDTTPAKPRSEMERVAKVIRRMNADVVALQEVENRGYLQRFLDVFLSDMGYEYVVHFEGNDLRGSDVCLISRIPIGPVTSYRHLRFPKDSDHKRSFSRDILQVRVEPNGGKAFDMFVVHLKSNHDGRKYAEPVRVNESKALRGILDGILRNDSSASFVVCGDFNDTWESETLKTVVGTGEYALRSFADQLPEDTRITYNRKPYLSMIDFILCSPAMASRYVDKSYTVRDSTLEASGSDHNPVLAKFKLK